MVVCWSYAILQLAKSYCLSIPCMHAKSSKSISAYGHEAIAHVYHLVYIICISYTYPVTEDYIYLLLVECNNNVKYYPSGI